MNIPCSLLISHLIQNLIGIKKRKLPIIKVFSLEICLQNQGQFVLETTNTKTGVVVNRGHDICPVAALGSQEEGVYEFFREIA
jgi:hypothetical protein